MLSKLFQNLISGVLPQSTILSLCHMDMAYGTIFSHPSSFIFHYLFVYLRERMSKGKGRERESSSRLPAEHKAWCRALSRDPWDHDPSWNRELDAWPAEPLRCLSPLFDLDNDALFSWSVIHSVNLPILWMGREDQDCRGLGLGNKPQIGCGRTEWKPIMVEEHSPLLISAISPFATYTPVPLSSPLPP